MACQHEHEGDWRDDIQEALSAFGHRNWVVVADSAFPMVTAPGIWMVITGAEQDEVLAEALGLVNDQPHLAATVYVDAELEHVPNADAPGIAAFRTRLAELVEDPQPVRHEELLAKLHEAGESFQVLLLKTNSVLPYTTVCLELGCGYWDSQREADLRERMG